MQGHPVVEIVGVMMQMEEARAIGAKENRSSENLELGKKKFSVRRWLCKKKGESLGWELGFAEGQG